MAKHVTVSKDEIMETVKTNLGHGDFALVNFTIDAASETPLGFLGDHVRIKVNITIDGLEKQLQYFAKHIPSEVPSRKEYVERIGIFYKEIEAYKTLFFDMKNCLSADNRTDNWRPECYFTRDWDLLIVEDLSLRGYYMLPERTLMDLEHIKVSIKSLARMHAASFTFIEKLNLGATKTISAMYKPEMKKIQLCDIYENVLKEVTCPDDSSHPSSRFWEAGFRGQLAIVDLLPNYSSEQKTVIKARLPEAMRAIIQLVKPSTKYRNALLHADPWSNNILFKDNDEGKPSNAVLVDFQFVRYGPPAQDLLFLIYVTQNKAFRDKYWSQLIDYYYECLTTNLKSEGHDVELILPKSEFEETCTYYRQYAVIALIIFQQIAITPPHIAAKFLSGSENYDKVILENRGDILTECFQSDEQCRTRYIEAMTEFIELVNLLD